MIVAIPVDPLLESPLCVQHYVLRTVPGGRWGARLQVSEHLTEDGQSGALPREGRWGPGHGSAPKTCDPEEVIELPACFQLHKGKLYLAQEKRNSPGWCGSVD